MWPDLDGMHLNNVCRAPVLVAIALVEHGMESLRAVDQVRKARKDAMNNAQVEFLMKYKRKKQKGCCSIF